MSTNNFTTKTPVVTNRRRAEIAAALDDCLAHNEIDAAALALGDLWATLTEDRRAVAVEFVKALLTAAGEGVNQ